MSDFWIASDPPGIKGLTDWCEAEVEKACLEMASSVAVAGWMSSDTGLLTAYPYYGGDWDIDHDFPGRPIHELLEEALGVQVCHVYDADKRHIEPKVQEQVLACISEVEAVCAKYRALCRPAPPSQEQPDSVQG